MADRVVRVTLKAVVSDFEKSMKDAANATATVGTEAEKLAQKKSAFQQLGVAGLSMGSVIAGAIGLAAKATADFDSAMSSVQASTHATTQDMTLLREAALEAGASTVFSATEAAQAIEELSKAGVATADILGGGLTGALDLAAAGELSVARAAEITATSLNQFGLDGANAAQVADVLAAGAGKAMGSVEDLANGLKFVGPVANSMGVSLEETTGVLALFAQQGIIGEQAGTSLRGVLSSLTSPSAQARSEIERLGITLYDSQGRFLGLQNAAGELSAAYGQMDGASRDASMGIIFGRETVTAATALYKAGAGGVGEWTTAVDESGYAAQTARLRLDNLKGDIEALGGAFETALIETGSGANDMLRTMAQALTGLVGLYNDLPAPVQSSVLAMGGAAAAVALTGGAAFLAVPKWLEFKATVEASTWSMKGIALTSAGVGLALGGLFMVVGQLAAQHQQAQQRAEAYADTLEEGTHRITKATRDLVKENLSAASTFLWFENPSAFDKAEDLGIALDTVTDAAMGNVDALKQLKAAQEEYQAAVDADKERGDTTSIDDTRLQHINSVIDAVNGENNSIEESIRISEQKQEADRRSAEGSQTSAEAYMAEADALSGLNSQLTELIDKINEANGVAVDAITANADYLSALDGLKAQVESTGTSLDENTVSGSANAAAMGEIAEKAREAAAAQFEQDLATMSADEAAKKWNSTLATQKQAFIDSAVAAGYNATEVQALADRIFQMPTSKEFQAIVETAEAQAKLDSFITMNNGRTIRVRVAADGSSIQMGSITASIPGQATGGPVYGSGPKGKDSELRMLAPGEHVLTAAEVDAAGGHSAIADWRAALVANSGSGMGLIAAADSVETSMLIPAQHMKISRGRWA